jgi:hypothetical protein
MTNTKTHEVVKVEVTVTFRNPQTDHLDTITSTYVPEKQIVGTALWTIKMLMRLFVKCKLIHKFKHNLVQQNNHDN